MKKNDSVKEQDFHKLLGEAIAFTLKAHSPEFTKKNAMANRYGDKMPFGIHPIGAAMDFAQDEIWSFETRLMGVLVLLGHDVCEDSDYEFPDFFNKKVRDFIQELTYKSDGDDEELILIHSPDLIRKSFEEKTKFSILCKLYDCHSNVKDCTQLIKNIPKLKHYPALCLDVLQRVKISWESGELNEFVNPYFLGSGRRPNIIILSQSLFEEKLK